MGAVTGSFRRIATEEAFSVPEVFAALREWVAAAAPDEPDHDFLSFLFGQDLPGLQRVRRQLLDLEDERLQIMDGYGVDVHLLSLTAPGVQTLADDRAAALARLVNDRLAAVIARHPDRFAGLAAIAPQDPVGAAAEIGRAIGDLKLNGVVINSHTRNEYLDDEKFWPIFEAAEDLGAPIYIHPRSPSAQMAEPYKRFGLETGIYGFQAETGLHGIRLICSGVFDRFPRTADRSRPPGRGHPVLAVAGGLHASGPQLAQRPAQAGADAQRVLQAQFHDHDQRDELAAGPAVLHRGGRRRQHHVGDRLPLPAHRGRGAFMDAASIPDEDKHKIFHRNAERVFGIAPTSGLRSLAAGRRRSEDVCALSASPGSAARRFWRSSSCPVPEPAAARCGSGSRPRPSTRPTPCSVGQARESRERAPPRHVPGMELAGVIDVAGPGSGWQAGDRVMAIVSPRAPGGGAQAELVVADADQVTAGCRTGSAWSRRRRCP